MNRLSITAAIAAPVLLAMAMFAANAGSASNVSAPSDLPTPEELNVLLGDARGPLAANVMTKGTFRSLHLGANVADGVPEVLEVTAETELDVTSATFSAGVTVPGTIFQGYAYVSSPGTSGTNHYPIFVSSSGTQTIQLTYRDAVPLRTGDQIIFFPFEAVAGTSAFYRLTLTGTVPNAARADGYVVK